MSDLGFILRKQAERNRAKKHEPLVSKTQIVAAGAASVIPGNKVLTACHPDDEVEIIRFGRKLKMAGRWNTDENTFVYGNESENSTLSFQPLDDRKVLVTTKKQSGPDTFSSDETICQSRECKLRKAVYNGPKNGATIRLADALHFGS